MLPLVEITTDSFSAIVPNVNDMPAAKLMTIMLTQNPEWQYGMLMNLLRDNVSPELHEAFDNLTNLEMQSIITQWFEKAAF
jgi:hypothetical protein